MNLHLRPRVKSFHPWKICTSFETTYWLHKQKNVSKTAMSVIPEYAFSPATVKLPSLHDRRYRLEVYANRFCHLRPPRVTQTNFAFCSEPLDEQHAFPT